MQLPDPPLLLITDRRQARRPLLEVVRGALDGGCRWISVRGKDLPPPEQVAVARSIKDLAAPFEALVTLHGHPALALEAGVDGAHLASRSDVASARAVLGPDRWLSVSTHAEDDIEAAAAGGADAVTLSPVFASASKPGYGPAIGIERLAEVAAHSPLPIIALGGVDDAARARACLDAGAAGIAVMGAIMRAADPAAAIAALRRTTHEGSADGLADR